MIIHSLCRAMPAAVLAGLVAACSTSSDGGTVAPPTTDAELAEALSDLVTSTTPELPCWAAGESYPEVPHGYGEVLDAVALPSADAAEAALPTYEDAVSVPSHRAQTFIYVRAGVPFRMSLNDAAGTARMTWGTSDSDVAVGSEGCEGEGWLEFAGGIFVDPPSCVELVVETIDGSQESAEIGVGSPCEGQEPPPERADQ